MSAAAVVLPFVWAFSAAGANPFERKTVQRETEAGGPRLATAGVRLRALGTAGPAAPAFGMLGATDAPATVAGSVVPESWAFYRKYTESLLRRYVKLAMEAGRAPSLLGQEMFRGKVTSYKVHSFEDVVIFVHDVGQCLAKLDKGQQHLIRKIALQEYTQGETAALSGLSLSTVIRRYTQAIDRLTGLFLERNLLEPLTACQGLDADL
jgi:hypothetical protein